MRRPANYFHCRKEISKKYRQQKAEATGARNYGHAAATNRVFVTVQSSKDILETSLMIIRRSLSSIIILFHVIDVRRGPSPVVSPSLRRWTSAPFRTAAAASPISINISVLIAVVAIALTVANTIPVTVSVPLAIDSVPAATSRRAAGTVTIAATTRGRSPVRAPDCRGRILRPLQA